MCTTRVLTVSPSTWSQGVHLVPGGYLVPEGCTWSQGVYLVLGGVPGPRGVYLVLGGVPGPSRGVPGPRGMYLVQGGCTWPWGVYLIQGVYLVWGYLVMGGCTWSLGGVSGTPPVNRMTNRCKNITLPQTSLAGRKNLLCPLQITNSH